jgi:hypothetical protein
MSSMKYRNVWAALCRLKNMEENSNSLNGVVISVSVHHWDGWGFGCMSHQVILGEHETTEKLD